MSSIKVVDPGEAADRMDQPHGVIDRRRLAFANFGRILLFVVTAASSRPDDHRT
jgi:hypothetical protein